MNYPTHALFIVSNWDGEGCQLWVFAYQKDNVFYCHESDKLVIEHVGDKILKQVVLK
tara:strand:+ start:513 stop:683 length:171 start_codon:yes stop_codon:yes gene_type:complete